MTKPLKPPSSRLQGGETMEDITSAVERGMLNPGEKLRAVLVMVVADSAHGKQIVTTLATLPPGHGKEAELLVALQGFLDSLPRKS